MLSNIKIIVATWQNKPYCLLKHTSVIFGKCNSLVIRWCIYFLPCQRSEGLLISPSLLREPFLFLIGKLRTGLVWLALITEHRLSFSSAGGGEPWPGPLGEITWSGLRPRGGMSQYDQGFASNIFIYCYLVNPFLLPRGSVHVLPLSQQTFFLSKKIFLTFINILSIFRMINHEK